MTYIACSDIQDRDIDDNMKRRNEMIYYGPDEELTIGGSGEVLLNLAISEVFQFRNPLDRTWISWNNEPACRKGLDSDKSHIGIFSGKGLEPLFYEQGNEQSWPKLEKLKRINSFRSVLSEAEWNHRAFEAISVYRLPFLVIFVPGLQQNTAMNDWRVQLAAEVNDRLRSKENKNFTFILC